MRAILAAAAMLLAAMLLAAGTAWAGTPDVQYGPAPAWIVPSPRPTEGATPAGQPDRQR